MTKINFRIPFLRKLMRKSSSYNINRECDGTIEIDQPQQSENQSQENQENELKTKAVVIQVRSFSMNSGRKFLIILNFSRHFSGSIGCHFISRQLISYFSWHGFRLSSDNIRDTSKR